MVRTGEGLGASRCSGPAHRSAGGHVFSKASSNISLAGGSLGGASAMSPPPSHPCGTVSADESASRCPLPPGPQGQAAFCKRYIPLRHKGCSPLIPSPHPFQDCLLALRPGCQVRSEDLLQRSFSAPHLFLPSMWLLIGGSHVSVYMGQTCMPGPLSIRDGKARGRSGQARAASCCSLAPPETWGSAQMPHTGHVPSSVPASPLPLLPWGLLQNWG